jgi:hypothetical protein
MGASARFRYLAFPMMQAPGDQFVGDGAIRTQPCCRPLGFGKILNLVVENGKFSSFTEKIFLKRLTSAAFLGNH